MALTQEQKQEQLNLRIRLKRDEIKRTLEEQRETTKRFREVTRENSEVQRRKNTLDVDGKPLWDKVREDAAQMIRQGPAGYNDWAVGMSNLISHFLLLNQATIYDPIFPFREEIVGAKNLVVDLIWDNTIAKASDKIAELTFADRDLPKLHVSTAINEKGSLDIRVRRDGIDLTDSPDPKAKELYQQLATGVVAWAMINGYQQKANTDEPNKAAFYSDPGDVKMTQEKFKELNADPENGLAKFLSGRFDMPLSSSISPCGISP